MKFIEKILTFFAKIIRSVYLLIDKIIIIPTTKLMLLIGDKFGRRTDRLEKWLVKKNTLVFISLLLAIGLFLYVDSESTIIVDDSAEVLYDQKVEVTYNNNSYVVEGLPESVDVTLIGRKVDLYLAKQLSSGNVKADLSNLSEGSHTITLDYDCAITSVQYKLDPSTVNVMVYPKVSETRVASVDVINKNKLDKKLSIGDVTLDAREVVIKGAEHTLAKVATVKALVDVNKIVDPTIGKATLDDIKVIAYDSDGKVVRDVEMQPEKLKAQIIIESPHKDVPLKVIPTGSLQFGKAIDSVVTSVSKVTIYGDQDILDEIENLPIEVDVTGLSENKQYDVILPKPSGIKEVSNTNIKVNVTLGTEVSKQVDNVYIETVNLDPSYKAVAIGANSSKTSVVVKGTKGVIDAIDASSISAKVDLEGYKEGEYEVDVKVDGEDSKAIYVSKTTKIKIKISKK